MINVNIIVLLVLAHHLIVPLVKLIELKLQDVLVLQDTMIIKLIQNVLYVPTNVLHVIFMDVLPVLETDQ